MRGSAVAESLRSTDHNYKMHVTYLYCIVHASCWIPKNFVNTDYDNDSLPMNDLNPRRKHESMH